MQIRLLALMVLPVSMLQAQRSGSLRAYSAVQVEIENKRNEKGRKVPDEFIADLVDQLKSGVAALHLFRRVGDYEDSKVAEPQTTPRAFLLRLQILDYTGAQNNAGVKAVAHFIDKDNGQQIFEQNVNAQLHYDSGALSAALRKLARSTASVVKDSY